MTITTDGREAIVFYYATKVVVEFTPAQMDAGAVYTLAVKALRNPSAPAMALSTGTVSGNRVVFEVNTFTQEFRAVSLRSGRAWLEIHTEDKVLLQREITVVPRADVDGEPAPTPAKRYYTREEVDAILGACGYATSGAVLALAAPVEVVDGSSTAATFTTIDGGTVYRFTQPLTSLAISAMPSDTREAVVIFSGGTAAPSVSLPASAGIVQMPEFTSGGKYVLSLQYGLAVGAEYEVES